MFDPIIDKLLISPDDQGHDLFSFPNSLFNSEDDMTKLLAFLKKVC